MKKLYVARLLSFSAAFFVFFLLLQKDTIAQTATPSETKYVRLDIGHGGLHCPFLGPELEKKIKAMGDVRNMNVNKQESYATFELPANTTITDTAIKDIAVKLGYPEPDVTIVFSDSPPIDQQ